MPESREIFNLSEVDKNNANKGALEEFFSEQSLADRFLLASSGGENSIAESKVRLQLLRYLRELCNLFEAINVDFLHIKGFATEKAFYNDAEARRFSDIDLLIPALEVPKVLGVLEELGFRVQPKLSNRQLQQELGTQHAIALVSPDGLELDLHWRLIQTQYGIIEPNPELFFSSPKVYTHQGLKFATLQEDLHFYFLCLHAYKDLWLNLKSILDISKALNSGAVNVDETRKYFSNSGAPDILEVSLEVVKKVCGTAPPSTLSENGSRVFQSIFQHLQNETELGELESFKIELLLRPSLVSKLRYLRGRLFVPHEEDWSFAIPDSLFFLHYITKPLKVVTRGFKSFFS